MGRNSGEQARRSVRLKANERYAKAMATRDKLRLVHVLRCAASRLEAEAKGEATVLAFRRGDETGISVTDHAVVRFLERVMGYDVDAIRAQIARLIPVTALPAGTPGAHGICVRDGFQFLITPNSVISVLSPEMDGRAWLESDELDALGAS